MRNQESSKRAFLQWLFLSAEGRIPRSTYWGAGIALAIILTIIFAIVRALAGNDPSRPQSLVYVLIFLPYFVASLCLSIKRLHDRNMSGMWVLAGFLPYVGWLFMFIVAGCLPGTTGANEYGKDPLAPDEEVAEIPGPPSLHGS